MDGIFQLVAGLVLRIFDLIMGKIASDIEAKKRFLAFVEKMSEHNSTAAKLKLKYEAQLEDLKKEKTSDNAQ